MRFTPALLFVLASQSLAGCTSRPPTPSAGSSHAGAKLRFADLINLDVRDVPLLMALDRLQAQGYAVEKIYLTSGALITDLLARGDAEIAMVNDQTLWTAITKGVKARTISRFTASTYVIAAKPEIQSCRELAGRSVGVGTARGLTVALFQYYLSQHCPGTEPHFLIIPETSGRSAALLTGAVDAAIVPGEELLKLTRRPSGHLHALITYSQEFPKVEIDGLHVQREWADKHPETVKDFLRELLRAQREVMANPEVLYEESMKRLSIDRETAKAVADAHLKMNIWDANGGLTSENVQQTIDFLTKMALLPAGLKAADVADLSYLNAVLAERGERALPSVPQ